MTQAELDKILAKHEKWINDEDGGKRADLQNADLQNADLLSADLQGADLRHANLLSADLRRANINFCSWPIWCGSLKVHIE